MTWEGYFSVFETIALRYYLVAGFAFLLFYVLLRDQKFLKKIQPKKLGMNDFVREITYSSFSMILFAFVPFFLIEYEPVNKYTTYYMGFRKHGLTYYILAFPLMALIHDAYFYWIHRIMHHKKLFKLFHLLHHKSTNPSPWAAYSFHPLEALLEIGIIPVLLFTIPMHWSHLLFFFFFMIVYNVYIHLGYELYPKNFHKHWLGKWLNTSVCHNNHHQLFHGNYSLYFTFWDRMMGTLREDYDRRYEEATTKTTAPPKGHTIETKVPEALKGKKAKSFSNAE